MLKYAKSLCNGWSFTNTGREDGDFYQRGIY